MSRDVITDEVWELIRDVNRSGSGGGSDPTGRVQAISASWKYPDELRERATRMTLEARQDPATRTGAFRRVGEQLGINPETLRN